MSEETLGASEAEKRGYPKTLIPEIGLERLSGAKQRLQELYDGIEGQGQ